MANVIKLCGLTKEEIEEKVLPYREKGFNVSVFERNLDAKIELSSVHGDDNAQAIAASYMANDLKDNVYSTFDMPLEVIAAKLLKTNKAVLSTAESLTGGLIAARLVSVAGISENFFEGIVCYDALSKIVRCGVDRHTIDKFGTVSKETAVEMVEGLIVGKTTIALSTTGVAGPSQSEGKDVGLVYVAVGRGNFIPVFEHRLSGDRNEIREKTTNLALFYLVRYLQGNILLL
ncbi:MAG: CinA family protein [Christensenellales bacterium]